MDEHDILKHLQELTKREYEYFSNQNKEERERWIVSEFLSILGIEHQNEEIKSLEQASKIDVKFREAQFQIKELTDPKCRRHKMYKDAYKSTKSAASLDEVSLVGDARDVPPITNMYELIFQKAQELAYGKYKAFKNEIDLLIYVTRSRASIIQEHEIKSKDFKALGWRSVSCVNAKQAVILHSSQSAPNFIVERLQQLINNH